MFLLSKIKSGSLVMGVSRARICKALREPRNRFPALAKSINRNQFLGFLNVYKYVLLKYIVRVKTNVFIFAVHPL
jgi:hypothetical protein